MGCSDRRNDCEPMIRWCSSSGLTLISLFLGLAVFAKATMPFHGESERMLMACVAWLHAICLASLTETSVSSVWMAVRISITRLVFTPLAVPLMTLNWVISLSFGR